jgi:hypothetical protein
MALTLPTTKLTPKYGSIVRLAREGATVETETVAADAKPAGSDFTDWETLGCIETGTVEILKEASEEVHCFNVTTGEWDVKQTEDSDAQTRLRLNLTLQEVTPFLLEMAYAAASVNATTGAYTPGSLKGGAVKGWLKVQTQSGTELVSVLDLWVEVILSSPANIANRTEGWKPEVQITQLRTALEAGAFGSVTA